MAPTGNEPGHEWQEVIEQPEWWPSDKSYPPLNTGLSLKLFGMIDTIAFVREWSEAGVRIGWDKIGPSNPILREWTT